MTAQISLVMHTEIMTSIPEQLGVAIWMPDILVWLELLMSCMRAGRLKQEIVNILDGNGVVRCSAYQICQAGFANVNDKLWFAKRWQDKRPGRLLQGNWAKSVHKGLKIHVCWGWKHAGLWLFHQNKVKNDPAHICLPSTKRRVWRHYCQNMVWQLWFSCRKRQEKHKISDLSRYASILIPLVRNIDTRETCYLVNRSKRGHKTSVTHDLRP